MVDLVAKQTAYGVMLLLPNDMYVGRGLIKYGEYCVGEQIFFSLAAQHGGAAIDVGANLGAHTMFMASRFSNVYAFEAQPFIHMLLKGNLAPFLNTTTYNAAVGSEDGILHLPRLNYTMSNNFGGMGKYALKDEADKSTIVMEPIQQRMLDKVDSLRAEDQISLIKIDVEGMELDVLKGAQALIDKHRPVLYVENDKMDHAAELVKFIYNLGYEAIWHITPLYREDNWANDKENIYEGLSSFNLICTPKGGWMTIKNGLPCTPDNPFVPPGCKV